MNWASLVWTVISLAGVVVAVRGLRDISADLRALAGRDGALRLLVVTRQRRQIIRLIAFGLYLFVGIETFLPIDFPGEGLLLIAGLYGGLVALILTALLEQVDRAMIRRLFP